MGARARDRRAFGYLAAAAAAAPAPQLFGDEAGAKEVRADEAEEDEEEELRQMLFFPEGGETHKGCSDMGPDVSVADQAILCSSSRKFEPLGMPSTMSARL